MAENDWQYLNGERLREARTLYDLLVLMWAEARAHTSEVKHCCDEGTFRGADFGGYAPMVVLKKAFASTARAANLKLEDDLRAYVPWILKRYGAVGLVELLQATDEVASKQRPAANGPLNTEFRDIGLLLPAPERHFDDLWLDEQRPPTEPGDSVTGLMHYFVVMSGLPREAKLRFHDVQSLRLARPKEALRVALVSSRRRDDRPSLFDIEPDNPLADFLYFRAECEDHPEVRERLDRILELFVEHRVHIGVMPELSMCPTLLDYLRGRLAAAHEKHYPDYPLRLVVSGTMHRPLDGSRLVNNEAIILSGAGKTLWTQEKFTPFEFDGEDGIHRIEALDADSRGQLLETCDAWFGRFAVPICLDYLAPQVAGLFAAGLNVLLVPAMSDVTTRFVEEAQRQGRSHRAVTVFANALNLSLKDEDRDQGSAAAHSFCYLPRRGDAHTKCLPWTEDAMLIRDVESDDAEIFRLT